jgi:hypothetical protein
MRKRMALGVAVAALLLATSTFAENRGVTFTPIGFHPTPGPNPASGVIAMNPQGTRFIVIPTPGQAYCMEWTREGGWGTQFGESLTTCRMSEGGVVIGTGRRFGQPPNEPTPIRPPEFVYGWPGLWTGVENVWSPLDYPASYLPCGSSRMTALDMGGEGAYATGLSWTTACQGRAYLWNNALDTAIDLGTPNGRSTRGNAVTADGSSVTGWATMAQGLRRAAHWDNGSFHYYSDPNGEEPKVCAQSGNVCTFNGAGTNGCPEYVDDGNCVNRGTCQDRGVCTAGVCVGGANPGTNCTSNNQCQGTCLGGSNDGTVCTSNNVCAGTCIGPNAGASCTSAGACPDTLVCINNPDWSDDLYKGEAYDVTDDGQHAVGRSYNIGWISNPDGTFTEIAPPAHFPNLVDPFRISQDGKTAVGRIGTFFTGTMPFFWNEGTGTQDLELFLLGQGLDELFFWTLVDLFDVSADGTVIGGRGINPDGRIEGFVVDMSKLWICHSPSGNPENARTLGVNFHTVGDHVAHGDSLGTCEFVNSGGLSRAVTSLAERRKAKQALEAESPFFQEASMGVNWTPEIPDALPIVEAPAATRGQK